MGVVQYIFALHVCLNCDTQALYIFVTLAIRFLQMGQLTSLRPQRVQVIMWPQGRRTASIRLFAHTLHFCSFFKISPSSTDLLAATRSLKLTLQSASTCLISLLVNLFSSKSDTRTTWSTSATCRRQIGHSVNFLPHWLQATRWPHSRRMESMSASMHTLHLDQSSSSSSSLYFSGNREGLRSP